MSISFRPYEISIRKKFENLFVCQDTLQIVTIQQGFEYYL